MTATEIARMRQNPAFCALERERRALGWGLAVVMMAVYGVFLSLVAFDKPLTAQPIGQGPLTLAFPLGLGVILTAIVLTGIYVLRANTRFDQLTNDIIASQASASAVR